MDSKIQDIKDNNHGWFAVDGCEDGYGDNATWIGRLGEEHEYTEGTKWEGVTDDFINEYGRKATEEEIEEALIAEAKRRYKVPCVITYIDGIDETDKLKGYMLTYDHDLDCLFASEDMDIVYQKGKWADTVPTRGTIYGIPYEIVENYGVLSYKFSEDFIVKPYELKQIYKFLSLLNGDDFGEKVVYLRNQIETLIDKK